MRRGVGQPQIAHLVRHVGRCDDTLSSRAIATAEHDEENRKRQREGENAGHNRPRSREAGCRSGAATKSAPDSRNSGGHAADDGRRPRGLGSRPFDADGLATRRNLLVERGTLAGYLYDTYSARKCGARSTGSAAGGGVSPTNLWREPGTGSLEELIASTGRGLLVTELMGMGFNAVTGDYSRGAAGFWIEGGELAHPVQEITIAGHLEAMLKGVDAVAGDLEWRGRVAAPSLRVARMTVAGQ